MQIRIIIITLEETEPNRAFPPFSKYFNEYFNFNLNISFIMRILHIFAHLNFPQACKYPRFNNNMTITNSFFNIS